MNNVVVVDLDNRGEYINEYDDNKICDKLIEYILGSLSNSKGSVILKINFNYQENNDEKKRIKDMLLNDFAANLENINVEIRRLSYRGIILGILGVFFFLVYWYLEQYHVFLFSELFLVTCWVAFWKVAEDFLFSRKDLIDKRRKYIRLLNAEFEIN